ncbi:MAG: AAA family ATPase [Candidatus Doudnabacteria bacterium]|jgi:predicted ATPase
MKYTNFIIQDYKGIKKLVLDLNLKPDYKIYTLIGLNESGKTTILEAINDFESEVPADQRHLLIPKNFAGGFTGNIIIKAELQFTEEDKKKITEFVAKKVVAKEFIISDKTTLERKYSFSNSNPIESKRTYTPFVQYKKTGKSKLLIIDDTIGTEVWNFVKASLFPEIIFYRDFLSKFPEKIYLQPSTPEEKNYLAIIEDVLTSIDPLYNVQSSLLDRLSNPTDANKQALEAVENQVGGKISKVVFDAWTKIQKVSKKEIIAKAEQEPSGGRYYIKLSVKESNHTYAISERSLGFRWFFTFLLFTEFRKERIKTAGEILFLLDEPASNLHQTAQKSLLGTFETIVTKARLIYTTHSHHLINPIWLNSAYIIKNKGLEYKDDDDFNATKTEVEAYKYKQFVSSYPTETSYFQPILDVLDYQPGLLELVPNIVITEGKFDYFTFKYFKEIILSDISTDYYFYPGRGASGLDLPISLYEAWGRKYIALLDADKEGKTQKARYIKDLSDKEHIFSLEEIDGAFDSLSTEQLFQEDEKLAISQEFNKSLASFEKSAFNTGIQILLSEKRIPNYITNETKDKIKKVIDFVKTKF